MNAGIKGDLVDQPIELSSCCFVLCKLRPGVDLECFMGNRQSISRSGTGGKANNLWKGCQIGGYMH